MGIRGLKKYVSENFGRDWEKYSLSGGRPFVVDGNCLSYHIASAVDLGWKYGGCYDAFEKRLKEFLDLFPGVVHIVFDGVGSADGKWQTIKDRKERRLSETMESVAKNFTAAYPPASYRSNSTVLPPLLSEVFRGVVAECKRVEVHVANGDADKVTAALANELNCPLVGNDSDYYVFDLKAGYIPIDMVDEQKRECKLYKRHRFARRLHLDVDLLLAIPALLGNDVIHRVDGRISRNVYQVMSTLKKCADYSKLERELSRDGHKVLEQFKINFKKARENYQEFPKCSIFTYEEEEFSHQFQTKDGKSIPGWVKKNFRCHKFDNNLLEILVEAKHLLHIVAEDFEQESAKTFSRPIRQAIYGVMFSRQDVLEIERDDKGGKLLEQLVESIPVMPLSIHTMIKETEETRINTLCNILLCNPSTLDSFDREWYLPIASLCFWANKADLPKDDIQLKALVLCFACLKSGEQLQQLIDSSLQQEDYVISHLHLYTQWQCAYYDAILLNQVLALPLPTAHFFSPAHVFNGKYVAYFLQQKKKFDEAFLPLRCSETQSFYEAVLRAVTSNLL